MVDVVDDNKSQGLSFAGAKNNYKVAQIYIIEQYDAVQALTIMLEVWMLSSLVSRVFHSVTCVARSIFASSSSTNGEREGERMRKNADRSN